MFRIITLLAVLAMLIGCSNPADDMGIVARVNGSPIYLSQLEFQHDQFQADTVGSYVPSVEKLKSEYGEILTDLIVQELVVQELVNQDIGITDHELLKAEEAVREDYPEGAFDQMLVEEYIDLKAWRRQLKNYLAMKKFFQQELRPQIKIDYKEAEQYYRDHISDFYLPESMRILVVRGPSREIVAKAVEKFIAEREQVDLTTAFGEVETREVMVREGRLSATWKNALTGLAPGQSSGVLTDRFGFEALVLLERSPAKVLEPAQAYPLVEKALLESKLQDTFEAWLATAVAKANITVSSHLLPADPASPDSVEPSSEPAIPEGLESPSGDPASPEELDVAPEDLKDSDSGEPESVETPRDETVPDSGNNG